MTYHPRTEWQSPAYPVTGPPVNWSKITTVVIHYTAAADMPDGDDPAKVAQSLRNMQQAYVTQRGYSLGYCDAVDQHGGRWQIRGPEFKSAANSGHNDYTYPVLVMVDGAQPASPAAVATVRAIVADCERRTGRTMAIKGHGQLRTETGTGTATACPGVGLQAQVAAGVFTPQPTPPTPDPLPEDEPMFAIYRPANWQSDPAAPWFCMGATTFRPAVSYDSEFAVKNGIPIVDVELGQYNRLRKSAGL